MDLTLVRTGPIGGAIYAAAFERVTGLPMRVEVSRSGRLDPDIFRETVEANELDPAAFAFPRFAEALAREYAARARDVREQGCAMPGAAAALAALSGSPLAVQTVLTGNVRPVAAVKLAAFGLDGHLDLDAGAYGGDAELRAGMVHIARLRACARHGATFDARSTVVVGDSRHDVIAGRDGGALVVAVASGRDGEDELRALGPDVVLPDLADTDAVVRAILGPG